MSTEHLRSAYAAEFERRTEVPILDALARRYSPRSFTAQAVTPEEVGLLLEAARWASSSRNEQPWRFGVFHKGGAVHDLVTETLMPSNRAWAVHAPLYIVAMARRTFVRSGQANHHAWHDLGLAVGNLTAQATALGFGLHQMAGFDGHQLKLLLALQEDLDPVTVLAVGRPGAAEALPEEYRDRERQRSPRLSLEELVVRQDG